MDDWLIFAAPSKITDHNDKVVHVLQELGWIINFEKSILKPSQSIDYIGFELSSIGDSGSPEIWITGSRAKKLRKSI